MGQRTAVLCRDAAAGYNKGDKTGDKSGYNKGYNNVRIGVFPTRKGSFFMPFSTYRFPENPYRDPFTIRLMTHRMKKGFPSKNGTKTPAFGRGKMPRKRGLSKIPFRKAGEKHVGRKPKEFHAFYDVGDDEVQIDSFDRKMNEEVLALARAEPEAVWIGYDEEAPDYLRAAVKNKNIVIAFRRSRSEETKKALSENGRKHAANLRRGSEKPSK